MVYARIPFLLALLVASIVMAQPPEPLEADWGHVDTTFIPQRLELHIDEKPTGERVELPSLGKSVVRAFRHKGVTDVQYFDMEFSQDGGVRALIGPIPEADGHVFTDTAEQSVQYSDGTWVFSALDAKVHGRSAKLESNPGNHRIGFWTDASDYVTWDWKATRWGMYDVELTYSLDGGDGTKISVKVGDKLASGELKSTGSWYRYRTVNLGRIYLASEGAKNLLVNCVAKKGAAVMNLKAVILRPAPEGNQPVKQGGDGTVLLHSRDAAVFGTALRYEPKPEKNTLGYWVDEADCADWDFVIEKPGIFEVEILQGCGKGQGGSEVMIRTPEFQFQSVKFTVQDTGHFQNFIPVKVGTLKFDKPGTYTLRAVPIKKAHAAVMDLRQVRLIPVK